MRVAIEIESREDLRTVVTALNKEAQFLSKQGDKSATVNMLYRLGHEITHQTLRRLHAGDCQHAEDVPADDFFRQHVAATKEAMAELLAKGKKLPKSDFFRHCVVPKELIGPANDAYDYYRTADHSIYWFKTYTGSLHFFRTVPDDVAAHAEKDGKI